MQLTKKERRILDALLTRDVKSVALDLDMKAPAVYQTLKRIRRKRKEARNFTNTILNYVQRGNEKFNVLIAIVDRTTKE